MSISHYLKEIGRGKDGARALSRSQSADLLGQVLDGTISDLEVGGFCIAIRIKGDTPDEMAGFIDAVDQRIQHVPASDSATVVLPSYNGARKLPVLTPLLALLLAREGLPVLLHGMRTEARRVLASDVLDAIQVPALIAPEKIANGTVRHIHTQHLHAGLARLLAVREVVGLRNPGHSVVKLMNPCVGPSVVVTAYTHPEYFEMLQTTFRTLGMNALLSRGLEGEVATDPRRTPRYDGFVRGEHTVLEAQQPGTASEVPGLPAEIDVATTATYTRQVLAGELPIPPAAGWQVEHILHVAGQTASKTSP